MDLYVKIQNKQATDMRTNGTLWQQMPDTFLHKTCSTRKEDFITEGELQFKYGMTFGSWAFLL